LTTSALGFIAICVIMVGVWDIFPGARSQTIALQEQASAAELSAAVEAQRQAATKLTRSASFDERYRKLSDKAQKKGTVPVIVKVRAAFRPEGLISNAAETLAQRAVIKEAQDQMLAWLRYVPSTLKRYEYLPYIAASVDAAGLEQLKASSEALDVFGDQQMRLATADSFPLVGATRAWAGGFKGTGKTVAVLDSGVDKSHPALAGMVVSEACYSTNDPAAGYSSLCPDGAGASTAAGSGVNCTVLDGIGNCDHGTHIAGIAAGRAGVAHGANVISIQVMSHVNDLEACRGQASCLLSRTSDVISALNRVYELRATYDIAAVNISLAGDTYTSHCDADFQPMKGAIDLLRSVNIAAVVASGNEFLTDALSYPACISSAVSVGATNDGSDSDAPANAVAQFSNSAQFLNLLAPGAFITSSVPGGGVEGGSGTSMAAAHVSGAWAMLKEKLPAATVDEVLNKLTATGVNITDPRNGVTKPRIQINAALEVNIPPDNWIGRYYNNPNLEGNPVLERDEGGGFIDRNFTGVSPAPGVNTENYSIRWTRTLSLTADTYRFSVTGDDGVRLYIDGQLKVDRWVNQTATTYDVDVNLPAGAHEIRLEYYQHAGPAQVRLIWKPINPVCSQTVAADHWKGEYFNNTNLAGSPSMARDEGPGPLDLNFGGGSPNSACAMFADRFSARWTRRANFAAGPHRFFVGGDDGVRFYIDGAMKVNRWVDQGYTVYTTDVNFPTSGEHDLMLEFYDNGLDARASVSWALLNPPSNLIASAVSASQINLSWTDNSSIEGGFKIERWNGSGYSQIAAVGANVTTHPDTGLTPATTYRYRVRAFNSAGDSGYSNESFATTFACNYVISPTAAGFVANGGAGSITVTSPAGCLWSATSNSPWVTITSGASGAGNGSVNYSVGSYGVLNSRRDAIITIAGLTATIIQLGPLNPCYPSICPFFQPSPPAATDPSATATEPRGLTARYFGSTTLSGQPALERIDPALNFNWAGNGPDKLLPADDFSVRWNVRLAAPSSEAYTFYLYSDGGARLWVNNQLVIDRWQPPFEPITRSAPINLKAGEKVDVRVEYYNAGGEAVHLLWSSASTPKQIIPQRHLYPEAATNNSAPVDANQQESQQAGMPPGG
jgi:subtilisin